MNNKMSNKVSRRAVLIAELSKNEKLKDAFNKFIASSLNNTDLTQISFDDFYSDSEDESSADILDVISDDETSEGCNECKCGKKSVLNGKTKESIFSKKSNTKSNEKSVNKLVTHLNKKEESDPFDEEMYESDDNNDEASDFDECQQSDHFDDKREELTEEEKRKKRNEKKKLQKKKKRDKRKAEKLSNNKNKDLNASTKSEAKTVDNKNNNNSKNNKKLENNKNESNTNTNTNNININIKNKSSAKQKEMDINDRTDYKPKNKEMDNKTNGNKLEVNTNGRNSRESLSVKSSPKSDRESDNIQTDVEEEELSLNSAYVTQIAQRKNKPSAYQKSAQTQNEAQDSADDLTGAAKSKISDDTLVSNYSDFVITNNSSQNNNQNKSLNNKSREVDDFPKYKQFFFEKPKPTKPAVTHLTKEEKNLNIEKSVDLAIVANFKAENNLFVEAIDLFSQAIEFNPKDYRFYVNRSYCYDSIQDYRNALKDAEIAIKLKPEWPKCHYRKGKALAGLKNYQESEIALKKVLTLENDCIEAKQDLKQVRYNAIVDMGYDVSTAELYSSNYDSIKEALNALSLRQEKQKALNSVNSNKTPNVIKKSNNWWNSANNSKMGLESNGVRAEQTWDDDDIYISDDEFSSVREPTFEETSPTNPFGWKALWIGNVSLNAKQETVTTMFRKFGNLNYCNIFKGNNGGNFILVHYDNSESPTIAMSKYQGKVIPGVSIADTPLTIRFRPNKDQKKPNYDQRLESDECYYWRTTGCARGDNCLYKHIQANKGVDKQAWMCNPLRKNPFQKPQK